MMQKIPQQHNSEPKISAPAMLIFRDTATYAIIGNNILSRYTILVNRLFIVFYIIYIYILICFIHFTQKTSGSIEHIAAIEKSALQQQLFLAFILSFYTLSLKLVPCHSCDYCIFMPTYTLLAFNFAIKKESAPGHKALGRGGLVWRNYSILGDCNLNITGELCSPTCRCLNLKADVTVCCECSCDSPCECTITVINCLRCCVC